MHTMSNEQFEATKSLHVRARSAIQDAIQREDGYDHRYAILAWAFVRGIPYRRCERSHHVQIRDDGSQFEHNLPNRSRLMGALISLGALTGSVDKYGSAWGAIDPKLDAWLADPSGAIPAPPPRPKKPYIQPAAAE